MTGTELLPCPFCGAPASHTGAAVRCNNFACNTTMTPRWTKDVVGSAKGDPDVRFALAKADCMRRWNQRGERIALDGEAKSIVPQPETRLATREELLAGEILAELTRARAKFPGKNVTFAALVEEVGELATAVFEESADRVRKEAVQVAVMAIRMILDGDHCFEPWRAEKGLDPLDPELRAQSEGRVHG